MDEMRSEIRAAFEKEQMAHAPDAALRYDIVDAVTAQPRRAPNFQWVAVLAAVILGVLVVVGLMSTRFNRHASVPANPNASPQASPVADYGPPPAGVPLLYVHDPNHTSWLIGYDWTGKPRGTVKLLQPLPGMQMAPDGQLFRVGQTAKGGSGAFLDRLGQGIPSQGGVAGFVGGIWADDNRHICSISLDQQTFEWALNTQLAGVAPKQVAVIARDSGIGQTAISLAACSFTNNLAIAVRTSIAWPSELWVIRLTDGTVLAHRTYQGHDLAKVVASRDGIYLAENSNKGNAVDSSQGSGSTIIRRISDWQQVAALDPSVQVLSFSGDDNTILASTGFDTALAPSDLGAIPWRAGLPIWTYSGAETLGSFVAQSDGSGFAIALKTPTRLVPSPCGTPAQGACQQIEDPLSNVLIVHGDGTSTAIPGRYVTTW
jgi:hypothetical protein